MIIKTRLCDIDTLPFYSMGKHEDACILDFIVSPIIAGGNEGYIHANLLFTSSENTRKAYYRIMQAMSEGRREVSLGNMVCWWDRELGKHLMDLSAGMVEHKFVCVPWKVD